MLQSQIFNNSILDFLRYKKLVQNQRISNDKTHNLKSYEKKKISFRKHNTWAVPYRL